MAVAVDAVVVFPRVVGQRVLIMIASSLSNCIWVYWMIITNGAAPPPPYLLVHPVAHHHVLDMDRDLIPARAHPLLPRAAMHYSHHHVLIPVLGPPPYTRHHYLMTMTMRLYRTPLPHWHHM